MPTKLYEITLVGDLGGQLLVNRWNYRGDGDDVPSGDAFGLASAMGFIPVAGVFPTGTVADAIAQFTSNGVTWNQVVCRAVYDPLDFVDLPFVPVASGLQSGDVEAMFVAYGIRSNRVRTDIGRGYKRFAGVNESHVSSLGVIDVTAIGLIENLCALMADVLSFTETSLTMSYTPVIAKKFPYTTPSGRTAYRYNPVEATQMAALAAGIVWESYPTVRSQVSRQIGKGK